MFASLAIVALRSERHNQYSLVPTLAACTFVSLTVLAALTFAPAVLIIIAVILATLVGCVLTVVGMIGWAIITDASRTEARERRETLARIAALEILTAELRAAIDRDTVVGWNDTATVRELGVLFSGEDTYEDIVILRDAIPMSPEDYEVTEDTWTSVLPGYRGTWAAQELADYSNDDRAEGDRVLTYCAGTDDDTSRRLSVATSARRDEWKNIMVRVQAEMAEIMTERSADLAPVVVSDPCPLSVLADDGCPHSMSWESGELVSWTPTMSPEGGITRCDRPCLAVAANSPVVPTVEEVVPLKAVAPITSEVGGWTNDELATHLRACGVKSARKNWTKGKLVAAYLKLAK